MRIRDVKFLSGVIKAYRVDVNTKLLNDQMHLTRHNSQPTTPLPCLSSMWIPASILESVLPEMVRQFSLSRQVAEGSTRLPSTNVALHVNHEVIDLTDMD